MSTPDFTPAGPPGGGEGGAPPPPPPPPPLSAAAGAWYPPQPPYAADPPRPAYGADWPPPPPAAPWGQEPWGQPAYAGASKRPRRRGASLAALSVALAVISAAVGFGVAFGIHGLTSLSAGTRVPPARFEVGDPASPGAAAPGVTVPGGAANPPAAAATPAPSSDPSATSALDQAAIVAAVDPAVVDITSSIAGGTAAGTGMVITSGGQVLTNNHVIAGATNIRVQVNGSGPTYSAHAVGVDPTDDVAVLQLDGVSGLKTVSLADSRAVAVGDPVTAIGNALGRGGAPSVSRGSVAALDQSIVAGDAVGAPERLTGLIQFDAPIQPGDSGGPLVNSAGRVIGMITAADAGAGRRSVSRIAFAIPSAAARSIADQIQAGRAGGNVQIGPGAILGVTVATGPQPRGSSGAPVVKVQPGSPAERAGLVAGDSIVSVGDAPIASAAALSPVMRTHHPGDSVVVGWVDAGGARHGATVRLAEGPPA